MDHRDREEVFNMKETSGRVADFQVVVQQCVIRLCGRE